MSSHDAGDWVRQSTPRGTDWEDDQSEYGTALEPTEWDDHAAEQTIRVARPEPRPRPASRAVPVIPSPSVPSPSSVPTPAPVDDPMDVTTKIPAVSTEEPVLPEPVAEAQPPVVEDHVVVPDDVIEPEAAVAPEVEPAVVVPASVASPHSFADEPDDAAPVAPAAPVSPYAPDIAAESETATVVRDHVETPPVPVGLFRDEAQDEVTAVLPGAEATQLLSNEPVAPVAAPVPVATPVPLAELDEERRAQELVAAERAARNERLGVVETSPANEVRTPPTPVKRTTDKVIPSFGLFFLRLVVAGILGIIGYQGLTNIDGTADALSLTMLPEPRLMAWIGGFTLATLALLLIIGLLQRVVGFVLLALAVVSLVFLRWGAFSPFLPGVDGFIGDRDLLLGAIGLLLLCLGGGGWGIDGAFRRARAAAKAEQQG